MLAFLIVMSESIRSMWETARDPRVRPLAVWLVGFIAIGATFYRNVEGWGWLDATYFCVISLATVGYGDLSPTTAAGKLFTIFYVLAGIGILLAFIDAMVERGTERRLRGPRRDRARQESGDAPSVDG
jgi:hypothetical protein